MSEDQYPENGFLIMQDGPEFYSNGNTPIFDTLSKADQAYVHLRVYEEYQGIVPEHALERKAFTFIKHQELLEACRKEFEDEDE